MSHLRWLSEEILNGISSKEQIQILVNLFHLLIKQLSYPVAHGTSSEYLESIIEYGLGAKPPRNASHPERIGVCDLRFKDGLLGAYAIALRGKTKHPDLCIHARTVGSGSIIQRYVATLEVNKKEAIKIRIGLWIIGLLYRLKRGKMQGWPILLIYDTEGKIQMEKAPNRTPSEFVVPHPLGKEILALILAPAKRHKQTEEILSRFDLVIPIIPLEILELEEILTMLS
ncbi:hypothetical protein MYX06_02405 [Patescibacteria group bacterium AH-259-L05]|nr:hypothetical protein [Patescibacteria group bacterium AH-259-L05]